MDITYILPLPTDMINEIRTFLVHPIIELRQFLREHMTQYFYDTLHFEDSVGAKTFYNSVDESQKLYHNTPRALEIHLDEKYRDYESKLDSIYRTIGSLSLEKILVMHLDYVQDIDRANTLELIKKSKQID